MKRFVTLIFGVVLLELVLYVFVTSPVNKLLKSVKDANVAVSNVKAGIKNKDWDTLTSGSRDLTSSLESLNLNLVKLSYLKYVPIVKDYYGDAVKAANLFAGISGSDDKLLFNLTLYKAQLGFDANAKDTNLEQLIISTPQIVPAITEYSKEFEKVLDFLNELDIKKYKSLLGDKYSDLESLYNNRATLRSYYRDFNEILPVVPSLLGADTPKTYLVLFQNDKELRPTGGFITAYALMNADFGKIKTGQSESIYEIKNQGDGYPPTPLFTYLGTTTWFLRDMNFSPDFVESMRQFYSTWLRLGQPKVDGIIAIDTQFSQTMLKVVGPVVIKGYDYDFAGWTGLPETCQVGVKEFNEKNVVCRLEAYAEKLGLGSSERKSVIGELMSEIFARIMDMPSNRFLALFSTVFKDLEQKHMLTYFMDEDVQSIASKLNWSGEVLGFDGDYLYVNDANLGGLKSDMYVTRSANQEYSIADDGSITKTIVLTYTNPAPYDGWLNAASRIYTRVYVPFGSKLIENSGSDVAVNTFEDLDKTVFDSFIKVMPQTSKTITYKYKLPFNYRPDLKLLIQKQPGVSKREIKIGGDVKDVQIDLKTDRVIDLTRN